jgi:hypothetical protein
VSEPEYVMVWARRIPVNTKNNEIRKSRMMVFRFYRNNVIGEDVAKAGAYA